MVRLPAVSRLLETKKIRSLIRRHSRELVTDLLREHLEALRARIRGGALEGGELRQAVTATAVAGAVEQAARSILEPRPRTVINATGVVVHTNLGRSTLSRAAAEALASSACGYMDLEYDLVTGRRGNRLSHVEPLMQRLFPGHGFAIFNNNAAAIMLCLRALCRGREAIVSRGELVEIGGSFRVPDILEVSGAKLREVGTTNRTRVGDYRDAITRGSGLLLKVHTSNFKIVGFTEETSIRRLAKLASESSLPLVVDWGSGDLVDLAPLGLHDEMPVGKVLEEGADLVTFSGDKLMGGPQAGFIVGRPDLVERVRKDPLARACRLDRLVVGALQRTLAAYVGGTARQEIPTLAMLSASAAEIERRARKLMAALARKTKAGKRLKIVSGISRTGGGSSPTGERPTKLISIASTSGDAGSLERSLRQGDPPVIGRIQDGKLLLDLRTVLPDQEPSLLARLVAATGSTDA